MTEYVLALKCPYCGWNFEAMAPDSWHSTCCFEEPRMSVSQGEVKTQKTFCQNGDCRKPITVYWYAPIEYLTLM
jgi:hypothetical protein